MRTPQDPARRLPRVSRRSRITILVVVVALIVILLSLRGLAGLWTDYLWFQSVGKTSVFRGVLLTKVFLALVFIAVFFVMMMVSLEIADRFAPEDADPNELNELVLRYREHVFSRGRTVRIATSAIFALLGGTGASKEWNNWDLFRYSLSFTGSNASDPQYHRNVGFYVFRLPFIEFLLNWAFEAVVVVLIVSVVFLYLNGAFSPQSSVRRATSAAKTHISVLLGLLPIIKGVDYYYERLELVLSRSHVVNGATATSVHAEKPALFLLMVIAVIAAVLFLANIRQRGWMLPTVAVALWAVVAIIVGGVYPALYQSLRVKPSEFTREKQYIGLNINATQYAYGLNTVQADPAYSYSPTVSPSQIQGSSDQAVANQQTLANVRILDPAVNLLNTFNKYQSLRSYYSFNDLDLDRYNLSLEAGGPPQTTATIASVRELNNAVPSGFVNQHLTYTHGYGAVVAPISQSGVNTAGTPNFTLSQLPPTGAPTISSNGSEVYFGIGSSASGYVIAGSKTPELDYENPNTGQEISTSYKGKGGVLAGSFFRRLAFALRFGDANFVLSGQITPSSRVMYIRNVVARAQKSAPFLKFDSDPYAVIAANQQLYWVLDAYTTTDNYPYSQNASVDRVPLNSGLRTTFNYVRNSVKVVVNAYDGSMYFFDMGTGDPILSVYERAFPDLFTPVSDADSLIPGITDHFRYPEDLFTVQTNMYGRYHLTNPADFYSQAQAWAVSPDPGSGLLSNTTEGAATATTGTTNGPPPVNRVAAQYVLAHLPGQTTQDFMLLTPFVPIASSTASQNLTAFMTASAYPGEYGQLNVYDLPPGSTIDGPGLIANAIRANTTISSELTLLNQPNGGSSVELGEVAIVPIDDTLLYVQPVYVESSSNQVPTLRDVVVVYNNTAYHSNNASLDAALCQIQNGPNSPKPFAQYCNTAAATAVLPTSPGGKTTPSSPTTSVPAGQTVQSLIRQALADSNAAQTALKAGDLGTYQSDNAKANALLVEANSLLAQPSSKG